MKVASIQLAAGDWTKEEQIQRARDLIERAGEVDLILLPELWTTGAFAYERFEEAAEPAEGPTLFAMREAARERGCYLFAGSWVERSDRGLHNTSLLLSPRGEVLGRYRKIHLFGYQSKEQEIMTAGESPVVIETPLATFGLATCYDLRFPELFRGLLDMGAEVFLIASGWPYPRLEHWILLNRVRALENLCFLFSSNSTGQSGEVRYVGHSMIIDPWGTPIASAGDLETIVKAEVDLERLAQIRAEFPVLRDRVLGIARK